MLTPQQKVSARLRTVFLSPKFLFRGIASVECLSSLSKPLIKMCIYIIQIGRLLFCTSETWTLTRFVQSVARSSSVSRPAISMHACMHTYLHGPFSIYLVQRPVIIPSDRIVSYRINEHRDPWLCVYHRAKYSYVGATRVESR